MTNVFTNVKNDLEDLLAKLAKVLSAFSSALLKSMEQSGGQFLEDTAKDAVMAAEAAGGTGQAKFDAAVASVIKDLTAKGIPFVLNAVQGAIIMAVAQLHEGTLNATTPVSAA
jgi:hypothetical protein